MVPLNTPLLISPEEDLGVEPFHVVFIDANHCPGSVSVIVLGSSFSYFYMGDSRVSPELIRVAKNFHANYFDLGWIDSTFYSESSDWDTMPSQRDSAIAFTEFVRNEGVPCALEFEMLGTEILLESLIEAYPSEWILVEKASRMAELEVVYQRDPGVLKRLMLCQPGMLESGLYRFMIIGRERATPNGFVRVRATTQRWASRIREAGKGALCPILEYNEERRVCYIFFSIHSCKREIDLLVEQLDIRKVRKLVPSIEIKGLSGSDGEVEKNIEKTRRQRCERRPFDFSCDGMWLDNLRDSQETVRPNCPGSQDTVVLPTWGAREF